MRRNVTGGYVFNARIKHNRYNERVLASVVAGVHGQFSISVEVSRTHAHIGDDFLATCRVINEQRKPFFIVWERKTDTHTVQLASSEHLNSDFKSTGRYWANRTRIVGGDIGDITFYMGITGGL